MANGIDAQREWLEADGLGGYASGTANGLRTRRYHALLLCATTPPTGRMVLVNGFDAWIETPAGRQDLSSQCYAPGVIGGDGAQHLEQFGCDGGAGRAPWPTWIYRCADGTRVQQTLFVAPGGAGTCLSWRLLGPARGVRLGVRPFLSGRDFHALHHANAAFRFDAEVAPGRTAWRPYPDVPGVQACHNGRYRHDPLWYYRFLYEAERERGLDCEEDLAAPGVFEWPLAAAAPGEPEDAGDAVLVLAPVDAAAAPPADTDALALHRRLRDAEHARRLSFPTPLARAADAYLVQRRSPAAPAGMSIIAGYPWFADWGRDTFISLRGLCLATGRLEVARDILLAWAGAVSEGMLPNRFPDRGDQPEYNSVDASLWFIVACAEFLDTGAASDAESRVLRDAVEAILSGYAAGTRYGIRADADGLLACGEAGVQLTWMDAKVGDWVVTPRIGKPVEVQALWLNALAFAGKSEVRWQALFERGLAAFREKFWNTQRGCLFDVVDANHQAGTNDPALRPNQIFAVGGLPLQLLDQERARAVVTAVQQHLWTPAGLRSLAPGEPGYAARYQGGVRERDGSYHQGTVWPWLMGAFIEAWVRVHDANAAARQAARGQFLQPLLERIQISGLGHLSEIADGDAPYTARGCPFQAWSMGELLRLDLEALAEPGSSKNAGR
ncbi:MAG: glycogen debranching enzyme N-terminal domain-containing protein [Burkholderiales bacterium]|nr:glycogen debranching enzyme N-terminal domain-containing protein [Burkholderiales bacterium]